MSDPWEEFDFDLIPSRRARRHVYDPRRKIWLEDVKPIVIKMQDEVH